MYWVVSSSLRSTTRENNAARSGVVIVVQSDRAALALASTDHMRYAFKEEKEDKGQKKTTRRSIPTTRSCDLSS